MIYIFQCICTRNHINWRSPSLGYDAI